MKTVAKNRRARFDYEILDTVEAGIVLTGQEVKSCRSGHIDLSGAYIAFPGGIPVLKQSTIAPYRFASNVSEEEPGRDRKLLLSAKEIDKLRRAAEEQGVTVLPLEVRAGKYIKLLLATARGRKTIDKRRAIKERDIGKRLRQGKDI